MDSLLHTLMKNVSRTGQKPECIVRLINHNTEPQSACEQGKLSHSELELSLGAVVQCVLNTIG